MEILTDDLVMVLCEHTDVSAGLLTSLKTRQIITPALITKIKKEEDPPTQADMLYEFLQKYARNEHLAGLKESLQKSKNWKALQILEDAEKKSGAPGAGQGQDSVDAPRQGQQIPQKNGIANLAANFNANVIVAASQQPIFEKYPATGRKKALIINVLKNRAGAEKDTVALQDILEGCGFDVELCQSFTEKGILGTVATWKAGLIGVSCIIVAVMSHGKSAYEFCTEDDKELHLRKDIVDEFSNAKCKAMRNMPKIFLANFCRGNRIDTCTDFGKPSAKTETDSKISSVETDSVGSYTDILICHGTFDEHYAYRDREEGTWYMQSFCRAIKKYADGLHDFVDIVNYANREVSEKKTEWGGSQCPPFENFVFCKKLYLKYNANS